MPPSFQARKKGTELWPHILRPWGKAGQAWRRAKGVVGNGSGSCLLPEAVAQTRCEPGGREDAVLQISSPAQVRDGGRSQSPSAPLIAAFGVTVLRPRLNKADRGAQAVFLSPGGQGASVAHP